MKRPTPPAPRRSNAPIFWALFGAGGMLSALLGPVLVLITGLLVPLGLLPGLADPARVLRFAQHPLGKLALLAVIALFAWHAAHRLFHSLHDLGLHTGALARLACYGSALVITLAAAACLLAIG